MTRAEMLDLIHTVLAKDEDINVDYIQSLYGVDLEKPESSDDKQLGCLIDAWADFGDGFEDIK